MLNAPAALEPGVGRPSWLAVTFHEASGTSARGIEAISSSTVHCVFRSPLPARTFATSAGVTNDPEFPKLARTYDATSAIHWSLFDPIGTMTCEYVLPSIGPVRPCSTALIT